MTLGRSSLLLRWAAPAFVQPGKEEQQTDGHVLSALRTDSREHLFPSLHDPVIRLSIHSYQHAFVDASRLNSW